MALGLPLAKTSVSTVVPRTRSLRTRYAVATSLVVAVAFAVYAAFAVRVQREALAEAERARQVLAVRRTAEHFQSILDAVSHATDRVAFVLTDPRIEADAVRLELARETVTATPGLHDGAIYLPDGQLLDAIAPGNPDPSLPPRPDVRAINPETLLQGRWLPASPHPRGPVLRWVRRIERDHVVRATVIGTLDPARFCHNLATVSADHLGRDDRLNVLEDGERPLGALCGQRNDTAALVQIRGSAPRELVRNDFGFSREVTDAHGNPVVATVESLPAMGWLLVAQRPAEEAFAALYQARQALILRALLSVILAAAVGAWLAARVTEPLKRLTALALAYGRREFSRRSLVTTRDELSVLGGAMEEMADEIRRGEAELVRRDRIERDLARYLPESVAAEIARGDRSVTLGGQRSEVTVLFADVVAFTPFAEATEPERVLAFLNELFTVLSEVVFRHGGTLDKFVGDCVMAVFGAPTPQEDHVDRALAVAEDMHRFVSSSASHWKATYNFEVRLAIGVHTGDALVGNLGSETRLDYTVIGDTVNVAARLETLARPGRTLVSDAVVKAYGSEESFAPLGPQPLRGKREAVLVWEANE